MGTLYTGFGDEGYTKTLDCERLLKSDDRVELLGTLDEVIACLGVARAHNPELEEILLGLQQQISCLMGEVAGADRADVGDWISEMEALIDRYMPKTTGFTFPGKTLGAAELDRTRTVIRRAERVAVRQRDILRSDVLVYFNRLSDLVYALVRCIEQ